MLPPHPMNHRRGGVTRCRRVPHEAGHVQSCTSQTLIASPLLDVLLLGSVGPQKQRPTPLPSPPSEKLYRLATAPDDDQVYVDQVHLHGD